MAFVGAQVTVDSTADVIYTGPGSNGARVNVRNRGPVAVFLGGPTVDDSGGSAGYQLDSGENVSLYVDPGEVLYGITAASSSRVDVLAGGVD